LTFYDVLKTNCNPNPSIEIVHGKMMPFTSHALHFICVILTKLSTYANFNVITQKRKILRIPSFDML